MEENAGKEPGIPWFYEGHDAEALLRKMLELSSAYYWEQDAQFRFTLVRHRDAQKEHALAKAFMGKTWWELGGVLAPGEKSREGLSHSQHLHKPYNDLIVRYAPANRKERYFSISGQPVFDNDGKFLGYRGITRDATDQKIQERLLRLEREISRILLDVDKVTEALHDAMHAICLSEGWDAGQYWRLDEDKSAMVYFTGWDVGTKAVRGVVDDSHRLEIRKGQGVVGVVWESAEALWISDLAKEKRLLRQDLAAITGWRQGLLFPVTTSGKVVGVLIFYAVSIQEPDERMLNLLQVLGQLIGNHQVGLDTLRQLKESEERYQSTVELAAIGIAHVDNHGRFISVNPRFCAMLGYDADELLAMSVNDITHPEDVHLTDIDRDKLRRKEIDFFKIEKRYLHKNGDPVWVSLTVASKLDRQGGSLYDISIVEDINARVEAERKVHYLATHDVLTGLPNRGLFLRLLSQSVASGKRYDRQFAVIFIDLDRFKLINDTLGHEAGDTLLIELAGRFRECLSSSDVVARLGGDEFVVLVQEINTENQVAVVAKNLLSAAIKPVSIKGQDIRVTASLGICMFPSGGLDERSLMQNADMAMYQAKGDGKNNFQFYSQELASLVVEKMSLETRLRNAMENQEFEVQYLARVNIRTKVVAGVEALLRWNNPELGLVSPAHFIPVVEEMGLIIPLGNWVLRTACEQNIAWQKQGLPPFPVSVNISASQFADPEFGNQIRLILENTGLAPHLLELEFTESMIMHKVEESILKISEFKALGVRVAIDNFGTGYSTLSQLKQFPIDALKVDRSFIRTLPDNQEDRVVTEAIIAMAKTLGLTVIAEGVETEAQQHFLQDHACDELQGYFFSKALPGNEVFELLQKVPKIPE